MLEQKKARKRMVDVKSDQATGRIKSCLSVCSRDVFQECKRCFRM